ncbi:hypothetical protein Ssi02_57490 [Sinosporangium siamense]|uniref:Uncharacterized protein n=1 Tax=Sinosporangium siamense TaxID=1367973 RepID=A0A919RKM1_9ACTN|nr:hypothetical protein Ssi02_57490 [Sinosporangium siamense]
MRDGVVNSCGALTGPPVFHLLARRSSGLRSSGLPVWRRIGGLDTFKADDDALSLVHPDR